MLKYKSPLTTRKNKTSARNSCAHALSLLTGDSKVAGYTRAIRELEQEHSIPLKTQSGTGTTPHFLFTNIDIVAAADDNITNNKDDEEADNIYERWRIATIVHCPSLPQLLLRNIVVSFTKIRTIIQMSNFIFSYQQSLTKIKTIVQMIILIALMFMRLL